MKYLVILFILVPGLSYSALNNTLNTVRVFIGPMGKIQILHVLTNSCRRMEAVEICFTRVAEKDCPKDQNKNCLPSFDMLRSNLPDRKDRAKWRAVDVGDPTKGMFVDTSIILKSEAIASIENQLDTELAKAQPDPVKAIRIFRQLQKKKNEPGD